MAWWLTQHLATVAVLAAIVHATTRLVRSSPTLTHLLWTIVLIKLVLPPVFAWPWSVGLDSLSTRHAEGRVTDVVAASTTSVASAASAETPIADGPTIASAQSRAASTPWYAWAGIAWMIGTGAFVSIHGTRTWHMRRLLQRAQPAPERLQRQLDAVAGDMNMPRTEVRLAPISSPLVWGGLRPVVLWPESLPESIHTDAVAGLLAHELAHVKRRDHWIGWLELAAGCAWWWNPLFWHIRHQVRAHAELACDAWVTAMAPQGRRHYAEALLAFSAGPPSLPAPIPAIGVRSGNRRLMERRLAMIMRAHVPVRLSRLALCTGGLVAALAFPAWAQRPDTAATPRALQPAPRPGPVAASPDRPVTQPIPAERLGVMQYPPAQAGARAMAGQEVVVSPTLVRISPTAHIVESRDVDLPAEAQELVRKFSETTAQTRREAEETIARQRSGLVEQLQKLQDAEARAGHLDQALAIRARVRSLQRRDIEFTRGRTVIAPDEQGLSEGFDGEVPPPPPPPPPPPAPVRPAARPTPAPAPPPPPTPQR